MHGYAQIQNEFESPKTIRFAGSVVTQKEKRFHRVPLKKSRQTQQRDMTGSWRKKTKDEAVLL